MNNALSSDTYIAIHNNEIRLYADGRIRSLDINNRERWIRPAAVREILSPEDAATFDAWRAEGAACECAMLGLVGGIHASTCGRRA